MAKYSFTVESDNAEADLTMVIDSLMCAYEKFVRLSNESEVTEVKHNVKGLDNRIDGLEAKLDSFLEVDISKRIKPKTETK